MNTIISSVCVVLYICGTAHHISPIKLECEKVGEGDKVKSKIIRDYPPPH